MTGRNDQFIKKTIIWICAVLMSLPSGFVPGALAQDCMEIPDVPLMSESVSSAANIFFLIDDSGSMDWEFLVNQPDVVDNNGLWPNGTGVVAYLYQNVDNNYPWSNNNDYGNILGISDDTREKWKATYAGYNYMYYDPNTYYEPWISGTGDPMPNADPDTPRTRPIIAGSSNAACTSTDSGYYTSMDDEWVTLGGSTTYGLIADNTDNYTDNEDGIFGWSAGWHTYLSGSVYYLGTYGDDMRRTATANDWATWTYDFTNQNDGSYHVEAWVPCLNPDNAGTSYGDDIASYSIQYEGGAYQTTMDQGGVPGDSAAGCQQWVRLTENPLPFTAQGDGIVTLTRTNTDGNARTIADAIRFITEEDATAETNQQENSFRIPISHYYAWDDADNDQTEDDGEIYLVILNQDNTSDYYQVGTIPADGVMTVNNLTQVAETDVPASVRTDAFKTAEDYKGPETLSARQNFANWYQYYRRRWMTAVYAISKAVDEFSGVNIGMGGINALIPNSPATQENELGIIEPLTPVRLEGANNSEQLLNALFNYEHIAGYASTPLLQGYAEVAEYYHTEQGELSSDKLGPSPLKTGGGECGLNFIVVFTDGYYQGRSDGSGDIDDDVIYAANDEQISGCAPFYSSASNSFADLVMEYYAYDIAPNLEDNVPMYLGIPPDYVTWQHINTYSVTLGMSGSLNPDDYNLYGASPVYPPWPSPINRDPYKVDDMWHGAVNGRGEFFSAKNPQDLIAAFQAIAQRINDRIGTGARATSSSTQLVLGTRMFLVGYNGIGWSGSLSAQNLNTDQNNLLGDVVWDAHTILETLVQTSGHTARNIATYNGSSGVAFDWGTIGSGNQGDLMYQAVTDAGLTGTELVNYLRGDKTHEVRNGGIFRDRLTSEIEGGPIDTSFTLGDIVHSSATYEPETNMIYVGANDGFLHAFDGETGEERFAYAPSFVMENMKLLPSPGYSHKFMVDETPVIQDTGEVRLLAGGLGKGGRGIYCLDVTTPQSNTQDTASTWVKWEFPNAQTASSDVNDMGYSFGQPYIVKTNRADQPWMVIFNNGYASPNERAVLFLVDAFSGELVRSLDTREGTCNGLSDITVTDPNADGVADYVYAGDLNGNMWKFDITDEDPALWSVAYGTASSPQPLFRARDADGNAQPITAKPDVMEHCDPSKPGYIVIFGTGKFLGADDIGSGDTATRQQSVYGVWDFGDDDDDNEYPGRFDRAGSTVTNFRGLNMVEQAITISGDSGSVTCNDTCWETVDDSMIDQDPDPNATSGTTDCEDESGNAVAATAGWFMDLPMEGERVVFDVMIIEGSAYILTLSPDVSGRPCSEGGVSGIYIVNACDGGCQLPVDEELGTDGSYTDRYDYDTGYDVYNRSGEELAISEGTGSGGDGSGGDGSGTDGSGTDGSGTDGSGTDGSGTDGSGGTGSSGAPNVTIGDASVGLTVLFNPETGQYVLPPTLAGGGIGPSIISAAQKIGLIYWRVVD